MKFVEIIWILKTCFATVFLHFKLQFARVRRNICDRVYFESFQFRLANGKVTDK
jgi:hypothetical protein